MTELEAQIDVLSGDGLALAVARYLHDHPDARDRVAGWIDDDVKHWEQRGAAVIGEEAGHRLEVLERWFEEAEAQDAELYETRRVDAVHARMALQSARSGEFGTAAGPLADFLSDAGGEPDTLHLG